MSFKRFFEKIRYLDNLISKKATGSQKELARRLGLSVSTLNEYLREMKEADFPIEYSRKRRTYYYTKTGKMVSQLFEETLTNDQLKNIDGGTMYYSWRPTSEKEPAGNIICNQPVHSDYIGANGTNFVL